jgi:hypothetical protein
LLADAFGLGLDEFLLQVASQIPVQLIRRCGLRVRTGEPWYLWM